MGRVGVQANENKRLSGRFQVEKMCEAWGSLRYSHVWGMSSSRREGLVWWRLLGGNEGLGYCEIKEKEEMTRRALGRGKIKGMEKEKSSGGRAIRCGVAADTYRGGTCSCEESEKWRLYTWGPIWKFMAGKYRRTLVGWSCTMPSEQPRRALRQRHDNLGELCTEEKTIQVWTWLRDRIRAPSWKVQIRSSLRRSLSKDLMFAPWMNWATRWHLAAVS